MCLQLGQLLVVWLLWRGTNPYSFGVSDFKYLFECRLSSSPRFDVLLCRRVKSRVSVCWAHIRPFLVDSFGQTLTIRVLGPCLFRVLSPSIEILRVRTSLQFEKAKENLMFRRNKHIRVQTVVVAITAAEVQQLLRRRLKVMGKYWSVYFPQVTSRFGVLDSTIRDSLETWSI